MLVDLWNTYYCILAFSLLPKCLEIHSRLRVDALLCPDSSRSVRVGAW